MKARIRRWWVTLTRWRYLLALGVRSDVCDGKTASYNADNMVHVDHLPGADLIRAGVADLAAGIESVPALLVAVGVPRLRQLGYAIPDGGPNPELRLYALLAQDDPDSAHGRYNALVRRLVSFERALACAR